MLYKPGDGRAGFPGQTNPTASVTGMLIALSQFRTAMRTRSSAIGPSKSRAMSRWPSISTARSLGSSWPCLGSIPVRCLCYVTLYSKATDNFLPSFKCFLCGLVKTLMYSKGAIWTSRRVCQSRLWTSSAFIDLKKLSNCPPFLPYRHRPIESDAVWRGDEACELVLQIVRQGRIVRELGARGTLGCAVCMPLCGHGTVIEIPATGRGVAPDLTKDCAGRTPQLAGMACARIPGRFIHALQRKGCGLVAEQQKGAKCVGGISPELRNQRPPTAAEIPASTPASWLKRPAAIPSQNRHRF